MRRPCSLLFVTLALLGCSPVVAPVAPESTLPALVAPAPAPTAAPLLLGAAATDADFRTRPPALEPFGPGAPTTFTFPAVTAMALANGARAQVVERHDLPLVHLAVLLASPRSPASDLLCASLLQVSGGGDRPLADELTALEVHIKGMWCDVFGVNLVADLVPTRLEPVLVTLMSALRDGAPTAARLADVRKRRVDGIANETLRDRMKRVVDGLLYPASDPAHDGPTTPAAALAKVTLADLARARAARRPEALTFTIVGDIALPELRATLDRVAARWPATTEKAPPPAAPAKPSSQPHGVVLIDDPTRTEVEIGIAYPVPPIASPDTSTLYAIDYELGGRWSERSNGGEPSPLQQAATRIDLDAHHGTFQLATIAPVGGAAPALKLLLADVAALGAAPLSAADAQTLRSWVSGDLARSFDGGAALADKLHYLGPRATIVDDERFFRGLANLEPRALVAFAQQWLAPERALLVAVGPVVVEKAAIEALGLGKAKIIHAPPPAKGASK